MNQQRDSSRLKKKVTSFSWSVIKKHCNCPGVPPLSTRGAQLQYRALYIIFTILLYTIYIAPSPSLNFLHKNLLEFNIQKCHLETFWSVVLKLFYKSIIFIRKEIHSIKIITLVRKLAKNPNINFQKWFLKYNFKNSKYIKNIEVWSLRTPALESWPEGGRSFFLLVGTIYF